MASSAEAPRLAALGLALTLALAPAASAAAGEIDRRSASPLEGIWRNARDTVHVEVRACAPVPCGYVVYATPKAQADARRSGVAPLIGIRILKDLTPNPAGGWFAKVFVPDLNLNLSGTASLVDPDTLKVQGCLVIGVLCKSQVWTRVKDAG